MGIEAAAWSAKAFILCGAIHNAARFRWAWRRIYRGSPIAALSWAGCGVTASPSRSIGDTPAAYPRTGALNRGSAPPIPRSVRRNLGAASAAVKDIGGNACRLQ